jgi:hypothetical protein
MNAILRCVSGPASGLEITLEPNSSTIIGRNPTCTAAFPADTFLSGRHFEIIATDAVVLLRDLGSTNGTYVNGTRVHEHNLQAGESVLAGRSAFQLEFGGAQVSTVVDVLSSQPETLYAVLDAARDPAIYPLLLASGAQYACLYSGQSARTLESVAPYLVQLPPHCELLQKIVTQGWSKAWGIFLTSNQPPQTIWHELRRSLYVTLPNQERVYFRFYDPRVLRIFLFVADTQQRAEFAGTMDGFLLEDEDPKTLLRFRSLSSDYRLDKFQVTAGDG